NELADTLGNFVNRTVAFAVKFFDGIVPELSEPSDRDRETLAALADYPQRVAALIEEYRFRAALQEAMGLARIGNKYVNDTEPWATRTSDPRASGNTIHVALQLCASLAVIFEPFLPTSAARMRSMVGLVGVRGSDPSGPREGLGWADAARPLL